MLYALFRVLHSKFNNNNNKGHHSIKPCRQNRFIVSHQPLPQFDAGGQAGDHHSLFIIRAPMTLPRAFHMDWKISPLKIVYGIMSRKR